MRIAVCAFSAVLLSGCSWLGMGGNGHQGAIHAANGYYGAQQGGQYGHHQQAPYNARRHDPCQIAAPTQPIPRGCAPSQVTVGAQNGFPQQPNFGGGQYASGGYGSHAANAGHHNAQAKRGPRLRKPKLRGQLSLGLEKSNSGSYLDFDDFPITVPYMASAYNQSNQSGSVSSGAITTTTWTVDDSTVSTVAPTISNDDVHSTPLRVAGGFEYILTPRTTVFANAGYSSAEGKTIPGVGYEGDVVETVSTQNYDPATGNPVGPAAVSALVERNETVGTATFDFSDMKRVDLEVGGRHYFDPIMKGSVNRSITPFVGASAGASHYNRQTVSTDLSQLFYNTAFTGAGEYYDASDTTNQTEIYGSQWVPSGTVTAGLEWQMTPKTAMAFETGVRVEGGREYSNGEKTDSNVAIPFTIRGSYNF